METQSDKEPKTPIKPKTKNKRVRLYATPKAVLVTSSFILGALTPQELFDLSESEQLDYSTLMILAGHLVRRNGRTKFKR
jgi:hypothetical protein